VHLVHNERVKLTAAWLNTVGAGTVIAGGVTPIVAMACVRMIPVSRQASSSR
jgi:hypothetical protein